MKHLTKKLTRDTARLLIAMQAAASTAGPPTITRHCLDHRGSPAKSPGAVVGLENGRPYFLALNVKIGDLISLSEPTNRGFTSIWHHFRIGPDFELITFKTNGRELTFEERCTHVTAYEPLGQPGSSDVELRAVLRCEDYPEFLSEIINRHIRNLRDTEPARYFQLVPWRLADEEIPDCVRVAPFAALEFHRSKLDAGQRAQCIRCSLEGGVLFAFAEMSPTQIDLAADECPGALLTTRAQHLTDAQVERCARNDPATAFGMREEFPPKRRAIILANSYLKSFPEMFCGRLHEFHSEVETSITRFPAPWLRAHKQDFDHLFNILAGFAQMGIDSAFLARLLRRMPPEYSAALSRHLAKGI